MRLIPTILILAVLAASGCQHTYRGSTGGGYENARGYALPVTRALPPVPVQSAAPAWPGSEGPTVTIMPPAGEGRALASPAGSGQGVTMRIDGPDELGTGQGDGGVLGDVSEDGGRLPWTPGPAMVLPADQRIPVAIDPAFDSQPSYYPQPTYVPQPVLIQPPQVIVQPEYVPVYEPVFIGGYGWLDGGGFGGYGNHDHEGNGGRGGPGAGGRGPGAGGVGRGGGSGGTGRGGSGSTGRGNGTGGGPGGTAGKPPVVLPGTPRAPLPVAPVTAIPRGPTGNAGGAPAMPAPFLEKPNPHQAPPALLAPSAGNSQPRIANSTAAVPTIKSTERPQATLTPNPALTRAPMPVVHADPVAPVAHATAPAGPAKSSGGAAGGSIKTTGNEKNQQGR